MAIPSIKSKRSPPDHSPSKNKRKCNVKKKQGTKKRKTDEEESVVAKKRVKCYASEEQKRAAMEKAQKIEEELLASNSICFLKYMERSHVSSGFWLSLPADFCKDHLQFNHNEMFILVVDGEERETKYLGYKRGLSKGWGRFSKAHGLLEADVLVFELLQKKPYKFKVHIVRAIKRTSTLTDKDIAVVHDDVPIGETSKCTLARMYHEAIISMERDTNMISGRLYFLKSRRDELNSEEEEEELRGLEERLKHIRMSLEKLISEIRMNK